MTSNMKIESIMFDWRLYTERGLPSYLHHHEDGKRIEQCEIQFLNKMLEEKNFANFNLNSENKNDTEINENQNRSLKSSLSQKNLDTNPSQLGFPGNKCNYCGKQHCDQPNHIICQQQQKLCEEEQIMDQLKQKQFKNLQNQHKNINSLSRPNSQAFCETPEINLRNENLNSLNKSQQYTIQTGNTSFECTGAIRKAGFLSVKKWLLRKRQHVELARKRGWKCYWACLKGTTLLFYQCNFIDNLSLDKSGAIELNSRNAKIMQRQLSGDKSFFGFNIDQIRPVSAKSNETVLDYEENFYENLANCKNCVHCSQCDKLISNDLNSIYQNSLEVNGLNIKTCSNCSNGNFQTTSDAKKINCLCDCHNSINSKNIVQQIAYQPKHLILIDNSIVQPIPEHPKREHVFCLSTAIGDAYLFQAPCENELNNWINAIQSACGASISRNKGKQGTLQKLQSEIVSVQQRLDKCNKKKQTLENQIGTILEHQQLQQINLTQTFRQQQQIMENEQEQRKQQLTNLVYAGKITKKQMHDELINFNKKKASILEWTEKGQFSDATLDDLMKQTNESNKNSIKQLNNQINQIDKQMEQHFCEQFRLRCYIASVQYNVKSSKEGFSGDAELPNPKTLLSHVTKSTKHILNKLGIFNVSSFHAYTCARSPQILTSVLLNHSQQMQSSNTNHVNLQPLSQMSAEIQNVSSVIPSGFNIGKHQIAQQLHKIGLNNQAKINIFKSLSPDNDRHGCSYKYGRMKLQLILPPPENTVHQIVVDTQQTIEQLIQSVLKQQNERQSRLIEKKQAQLDYLKQKHNEQQQSNNEYFACCKYLNNEEYFVPSNEVLLSNLPPMQHMQIVPKMLFTVDFERKSTDTLFGFSLEGHCVNDHYTNDSLFNSKNNSKTNGNAAQQISTSTNNTKLIVYVSKVEKGSLAEKKGLRKGDELVLINGTLISELDMMYVESVLQEELKLSLLLRAVRFEEPSSRKKSINKKNSDNFQTLNRRSRSHSREDKSKLKNSFITDENIHQFTQQYSDDYIDSLVCPPPPEECDISEELIDKLIIPKPDNLFELEKKNTDKLDLIDQLKNNDELAVSLMNKIQQVKDELSQHDDLIEDITKNYYKTELIEELEKCQSFKKNDANLNDENNLDSNIDKTNDFEKNSKTFDSQISKTISCLEISSISSNKNSLWSSSSRCSKLVKKYSLTQAEKIDKVINELLQTEITYVKHLDFLLDAYINPIKKQKILNNLDVNLLFGNMPSVIDFQKDFLSLLQECVTKYMPEYEQGRSNLDVYKDVLINISKLFLFFTNQFRQYSIFCSSHFKSQKLLYSNSKDTQCANYELIDFVKKRSKGEKANSLESYLIKPIQRILKYPLLLQQLKELSSTNELEHTYLFTALKGMERVAEHINEMQRINEEYGHIIENLQKSHYKLTKQIFALGPCNLLYYDEVGWKNISDFLGKLKKTIDLYCMCFVYKNAVVFFCIERNKNKKKNTHRNECVETVRYQILIPINEIQVRSIKNKDDLLGNKSSETNEETKDTQPLYYWELIHLKCSLINTNTQKRSEKVFQLYNTSLTFRNVFLRKIRKLIRESVRNLPVPSKTTLSQENVNSVDFSSKEELDVLTKIDFEEICKYDLDVLQEKQFKFDYFNANTLMQHLSESNRYEEEDKSCSSEKI